MFFWGVVYESEIRFWRPASENRFLPNFWHNKKSKKNKKLLNKNKIK